MTTRERPIAFSAPMVRAILDGRKTQTRRVLRGPWSMPSPMRSPYGTPGDRLWVRETWAVSTMWDRSRPSEIPVVERDIPVWWRADGEIEESVNRGRWRVPRFMPRWASRITLEVTGVRAERLQDISEEDARAEGVDPSSEAWSALARDLGLCGDPPTCREGFAMAWQSLKFATWASNPWVWVVSFRRL